MIEIKLNKETINKFNEMKRQEYKKQITELEERFFHKYSEHFEDNLPWLTLNYWPSVKYTLQCNMGVIKRENVDESRFVLGTLYLKDLADQHGSF